MVAPFTYVAYPARVVFGAAGWRARRRAPPVRRRARTIALHAGAGRSRRAGSASSSALRRGYVLAPPCIRPPINALPPHSLALLARRQKCHSNGSSRLSQLQDGDL